MRVADFDFFHFDFDALVIAQLEFRKNFKRRAELHQPIVGEIDLIHFRTVDRNHFLLLQRLRKVLGHQRFEDFALDIVGEAALDQRHRGFAGAKTGNSRHFGEIARDFIRRLLYIFSGNFEFKFTLASRFGCFGHGVFCVRDCMSGQILRFADSQLQC